MKQKKPNTKAIAIISTIPRCCTVPSIPKPIVKIAEIMNQENIKELIKTANNAEFHPSQVAFAKAATTFVHTPPQKKVKYSATKGRYKRHVDRKARGVKAGFGKSWSAPPVWFRVELNWYDVETQDESNEQIHWISCRKFQDKEYQFYKRYFDRCDKGEWCQGETVESKFVLRYISAWFIENRDKQHLNQAFIFPAPNKDNETIREAIYQVRWLGEYEWEIDEDLAIVLKKSIWHQWEEI